MAQNGSVPLSRQTRSPATSESDSHSLTGWINDITDAWQRGKANTLELTLELARLLRLKHVAPKLSCRKQSRR
jgi:hypothetical protein